MRRFIAGLIGVAGIFLATQVYADGTATVKFDTVTIGSQALAKAPVMTDNAGTKFDSGALTITSGSVTVTTSLTACDRVWTSITTGSSGTTTTTLRNAVSGAGFTVTAYDATGNVTTGNYTGHWLAIDE